VRQQLAQKPRATVVAAVSRCTALSFHTPRDPAPGKRPCSVSAASTVAELWGMTRFLAWRRRTLPRLPHALPAVPSAWLVCCGASNRGGKEVACSLPHSAPRGPHRCAL